MRPDRRRGDAIKVLSEEERAHDYLWRIHKACPRKGIIGIFNRSHYEDVLVVKVKSSPNRKPSSGVMRKSTSSKDASDNGTRIVNSCCNFKGGAGQTAEGTVADPAKQWKSIRPICGSRALDRLHGCL